MSDDPASSVASVDVSVPVPSVSVPAPNDSSAVLPANTICVLESVSIRSKMQVMIFFSVIMIFVFIGLLYHFFRLASIRLILQIPSGGTS